jgi:hypothetical protein
LRVLVGRLIQKSSPGNGGERSSILRHGRAATRTRSSGSAHASATANPHAVKREHNGLNVYMWSLPEVHTLWYTRGSEVLRPG